MNYKNWRIVRWFVARKNKRLIESLHLTFERFKKGQRDPYNIYFVNHIDEADEQDLKPLQDYEVRKIHG